METGLTLVCLRCGHCWLRRSLAKIPGTCPRCCSPYWNRSRQGEEPPKAKLPTLPQTPDLRPCPLTRAQALQVAAAVIHALQGYRKNPDYRTIQNDLRLVCNALQCASTGETIAIAKLRE